MDIRELNSTPISQGRKQPEQKSSQAPASSPQLMNLFEEELKNICRAEKSLAKAIHKMIEEAISQELIDALTNHLAETENQIIRAEQVFESIGKKIIAKKCGAMDGLVDRVGGIVESYETGAICDAGVILAGWKTVHYEMASYRTLRQFAKKLGLTEAVSLLEAMPHEEKSNESNNVSYKAVFVCPGYFSKGAIKQVPDHALLSPP